MKRPTNKEIVAWIDQYLYDPRLESEALLRKRWAWMWIVSTFIGVLLSTFLILVYFELWSFLWMAAVFNIGYLVALPLFRRLKRFDIVLNIQFSCYIISAFFAMLQAGGFPSSLGFVFIGINCAMGSVLAGNVRWTIGLFILYCLTIIVVGICQPFLVTPDYLTPAISTIAFVFLTVWINACIFFLVVLFMKDKSRYEKAETERVKKLDDAKTLLYTNVSHEFRTPLTVIQGIAEQMEKHPEKWQQTGPGKIKAQSHLLLRLVSQMLDISKIEADSMQLHLIHGDIKKYVQYIAGSFHSLAENKDIEVQIKIEDDSIYTDYDPEKLMHVLGNLLSNAIKFTSPGGLIIVEVFRETEKGQEMVRMHIRDNGRGIPQEDIGRIFERFYQVPDQNDQTPGTGLGLALTRELVKMMNGEIYVISELGVGTEFMVTLPISRNAKIEDDDGISLVHSGTVHSIIPNQVKGKGSEIHPSISSEKPILLIVEDNKDVVEYLVITLEEHYMIKLASNGKAGLKKATEIIPDIILTDVMMPLMDGFEMLKLLKEDIRTDHIPVVVLTARGDFQSKLTGLEIGADHYLVKPFSEKELFLRLNNLLEARRKMQKKLGTVQTVHQKGSNLYRQELQFLTKINTLLDEQLHDENFGIKEICLFLGMSRPQLYRKFTALTDKSIGRYIRSYRLQKAKAMMENEGKNVSEAAIDSGFKNLSHFSTIFREEFGYSPSDLL